MKYLRGKELYFFLFLLMAVVLFVFKDFLFLRKAYLFKDIGSDSVNGLYPQLVHLVDYLRTEGLPRWTFNQGMGQNFFPYSFRDPFVLIFYLLGRENIAYGVAYVEVLKIVLGGVFFFLYLRTRSVSNYAAIIGGLLYAFSGYMIVGSGWYGFSYEALCAAFLLYSFEMLLKHGVWMLLPIPIVLISSFQPFYLYLYGILLFVYAAVRFGEENGWNLRRLAFFLLKLIGIFALGVVISSANLFSDVLQLVQSPRVEGEASFVHKLSSEPVFGLAPSIQIVSALARAFSSDLLGTANNFRGWDNYLEAPLIYCGLVCLLLAPQFFSHLDRQRRFMYLVIVGLCILPYVFPYLRYLFWAFTGDYYRAFSFFTALLILNLSLQALSQINRYGKLNIKLLVCSLLLALAILYLPFYNKNELIDSSLRSAITVFLVAYSAFVVFMQSRRYRLVAQGAMILVVCIELAYFSSITVSERNTITSTELSQKIGYNDYTNEAVNYLNSIDNTFFRVNKDYTSGPATHISLNDAKIQKYKGTPSYHQFNQEYYIRFQQEMDIIHAQDERSTRWAEGLLNRPLLQTMASVKYSLTKGDGRYLLERGNEYLTTFGDVHVFKNKYYLPLGFTYDTYIVSSDFSKLPPHQKERVLLSAFVIADAEKGLFRDFQTFNPGDTTMYYGYEEYVKDTDALKQDTLSISEHDQNQISGTINLRRWKLLFFSIPYDEGWHARVDGKEAKLTVINIGFMGLPLDAGRHTIELKYFPPYLKEGMICSLAGILVYISIILVGRRKRVPRAEARSQFSHP